MTHSKSDIEQAIAEGRQCNTTIERQIKGLSLVPWAKPEYVRLESYQLKAKRGRVVMTLTDPERAREEAEKRQLTLVRVVTLTEILWTPEHHNG